MFDDIKVTLSYTIKFVLIQLQYQQYYIFISENYLKRC
jgi:hypothetical protein